MQSQDIYKEIKGKQVSFPDGDSKFYDENNLIIDLLDKNNLTRPCSFQVLKDYSLFRGFPWNKLKDFKVKPPYQPKSHNWKKNMNLMNPYEIMINQTLSKSDKIVGEDTDKNRLWAADFQFCVVILWIVGYDWDLYEKYVMLVV